MSGSDHPGATGGERSFTCKSLVFGCLGALLIVVGGALNNVVREWQTPLIGNYLPAAPIALVLLLALAWNPTLGRWARLRFAPRELAVVLGLALICAWIPHGGFGRFFERSLALPPLQMDVHPAWRRFDAMGHLPPGAIPLDGSALAAPLRQAIAAERRALAEGKLAGELGTAGVGASDYAVALDLAALVPPREMFTDPVMARSGAVLAVQRLPAGAPRDALAGLLAAMPKDLAPGPAAPAAWRLAHQRLHAGIQPGLPAAEAGYERVYPGFLNGLSNGSDTLPPSQVPLRPWLPTLAFWLPLILCGAVASLMLALIVHRQWSSHEQLRYPIATLASSLMARSGGSLVSDVFRSRLFWWGFAPVVFVHGLNFLAIQFPGALPSIPLQWSNAGVVKQLFPTIGQAGVSSGLSNGGLYFSIIGLTYFIASEISFSVGISGLVMTLLATQWYIATGGTFDGTSTRAGAYFGYAAIILFTGRHYYWTVLLAACGRRRDGLEPEQVWAARLFLLAAAGFTAALVGGFGMDWPVALCFGLTVTVLMLVVSRIVCETGIPLVQAAWSPANVVASMLGFSAIGPAPLVSVFLVWAALFKESRESLLPFASTALKIAENAGVPRLRFAVVGSVVMGVAVVAGILASLWGFYNFGAAHDTFAFWPGADAYDGASRGIEQMVETGRYAAAAAAHGLDKLPLLGWNRDQGMVLGWMGFGAALVLACAFGRFRWTWFPFHPAMFVLMGTWMTARIWTSILIGWAIKGLITRFGGGRVYQELKPLFIGMVAAELAIGIVTIVHPWLHYLITGTFPPVMGLYPA